MLNLLAEPGFWVLIGLPITGLIGVVFSFMERKDLSSFADELDKVFQKGDLNKADYAAIEASISGSQSKRGLLAFPVAPLMGLLVLPLGLYKGFTQGVDSIGKWGDAFNADSFAKETIFRTGIDPQSGTMWPKEALPIWEKAMGISMRKSPVAYLWTMAWIIPPMIILAMIFVVTTGNAKGPINALRSLLHRPGKTMSLIVNG